MANTSDEKPKKKPLTEGEDPKAARQALDNFKRARADYEKSKEKKDRPNNK